jgi:5-methylcytosine-specific restriction endonuclease McrA
VVYRLRIEEMWRRQEYRCYICRRPLALTAATFDHQLGRGMNGAHRDDRIEIDGRPINAALCWACNAKKGSQRGYAYREVPAYHAPDARES